MGAYNLMTRRQSFLPAGVSIIGLPIIMAACSEQKGKAPTPISVMYRGSPGTRDIFEQLTTSYAIQNSLNIEQTHIPDKSYYPMLTKRIAGGACPDVFFVWYDNLNYLVRLVESNRIQPLDPLIKHYKEHGIDILRDYDERIIEQISYDGKIYALPNSDRHMGAVFVNLDMLLRDETINALEKHFEDTDLAGVFTEVADGKRDWGVLFEGDDKIPHWNWKRFYGYHQAIVPTLSTDADTNEYYALIAPACMWNPLFSAVDNPSSRYDAPFVKFRNGEIELTFDNDTVRNIWHSYFRFPRNEAEKHRVIMILFGDESTRQYVTHYANGHILFCPTHVTGNTYMRMRGPMNFRHGVTLSPTYQDNPLRVYNGYASGFAMKKTEDEQRAKQLFGLVFALTNEAAQRMYAGSGHDLPSSSTLRRDAGIEFVYFGNMEYRKGDFARLLDVDRGCFPRHSSWHQIEKAVIQSKIGEVILGRKRLEEVLPEIDTRAKRILASHSDR